LSDDHDERPYPEYRDSTVGRVLILTGEHARELVCGEADPELGLEVEAKVQEGSRRWVSMHRLIVKDRDGHLWSSAYEQGLTEYQDTRPFEDLDAVTFTEVEKVPVTTYEYRPVTS
jgi:hypothetical protein